MELIEGYINYMLPVTGSIRVAMSDGGDFFLMDAYDGIHEISDNDFVIADALEDFTGVAPSYKEVAAVRKAMGEITRLANEDVLNDIRQ